MSINDDIDDLKAKRLCHHCVGEEYLRNQIRRKGQKAKCSYCGKNLRSYAVELIADIIETAFEQHYRRTSDQPDSMELSFLSDPECTYEWERHGEKVVWAIADAAVVSEEVAQDIQVILEDRYEDFDSAQIGEETEFSSDSYYKEIAPSDGAWQEGWIFFERSLKTEFRFFSRKTAQYLASIFNGIDKLSTSDGKPLLVNAGPQSEITELFRARVFQSDENLMEALCRPDQLLGPPPSMLAVPGRMNALGISVFYGANKPSVAIDEVRPPVGSQVAVTRFEIVRPLRLLDLTTFNSIKEMGSIFDPGWSERLKRAIFLRSLSLRMTKPVMPNDESFEYLPTQVIADFLSTENEPTVDGILFPSVQAAGNGLNVVLFHKAARVESMDIPKGTKIQSFTGYETEEGWEVDYRVTEVVPPTKTGTKEKLIKECTTVP